MLIDFQNINNELQNKIDKANIFINEPLKKHTSFKIGGEAKILVKLNSIEEIKSVLEIIKKYDVPFFVLGNGTNILVKDEGFDGIVLKISIDKIEIEKNSNNTATIIVGAGTTLTKLAIIACKNELSGLEGLSGIPGSIGGAIKMNAGAYGTEIKDVLIETTYIDFEGNIRTIKNEEHNFGYRSSIFKQKNMGIIIESKLELKNGNKDEIERLMEENRQSRREKQPIEFPSAGSTFKRGSDFITAKLIDECGLKGYNIGGAEVSKKHSGFIINSGNATSTDVLELIEHIRKTVKEKFGKEIELEIEIVG